MTVQEQADVLRTEAKYRMLLTRIRRQGLDFMTAITAPKRYRNAKQN